MAHIYVVKIDALSYGPGQLYYIILYYIILYYIILYYIILYYIILHVHYMACQPEFTKD